MMAPVARELIRRGVRCQLVSFAELRGFRSPLDHDPAIRVAIPFHLRRSPSMGSGIGRSRPGIRRFARDAIAALLLPVARFVIGSTQVLVVPNDTAFPYDRILAAYRGSATVLMQEGIRFEMPNGDAYGTGLTTRICAWGEGSRDFFVGRGASASRVAITGSPRHDALSRTPWEPVAGALRSSLALARAPLVLITNPIETQGFGGKEDRLHLFRRFITDVEPELRARGLALIVKTHGFEDPAEYARIAAATRARDLVHIDTSTPLFAAIVASAGAIVMTSTAGLEAQALGAPLAVLEVPRGGFAFEYVERNAAYPLRAASLAKDLAGFLDGAKSDSDAFVARHLHDRGKATQNVANVIEQLLASGARAPS